MFVPHNDIWFIVSHPGCCFDVSVPPEFDVTTLYRLWDNVLVVVEMVSYNGIVYDFGDFIVTHWQVEACR